MQFPSFAHQQDFKIARLPPKLMRGSLKRLNWENFVKILYTGDSESLKLCR